MMAARRRGGLLSTMRFGTIGDIFGIDTRALGALRIGTGALVLIDLLQRLGDVTAFYSDGGIMPRCMLIDRVTESPWCFSFHLLSGQTSVEIVLLMAAIACAVPLIAGFRTRLFTVISWLFLLSLQYRNPIILQGGDVLLRLVLFWGLFLPWGKRFSVESVGSSDRQREPMTCVATGALLLQICLIYWFSAWLKSDPAWRSDFTAVEAAFRLDHFAKPLAKLLLPFHQTLRALTAGSFWLEAAGPAVALLGGLISWRIRAGMVLVFVAFHAFMDFTLELGLFPAVCSIAWLVFLPTPCWNWMEDRFGNLAARWRRDVERTHGVGDIHSNVLSGRIRDVTAAFFFVYILLWNLRTIDDTRFAKFLPHSIDWVGWFSGTAQVWDMFSPRPLMEGGWFVMPAQLANGSEIDLFRAGAPITWEKPALVSRMYKNDRWRKYMVLMAAAANTDIRPPLGRYLCRTWNLRHPKGEQVANLRIILMEQDTLPGVGYTEPKQILLWTGNATP